MKLIYFKILQCRPYLHWQGGQDTLPFNSLANTLTFFTVPSSRTYQAFVATFEAMEAPFFQRETVLQVSGCTLLREDAKITPEESVAEDDLHCSKRKRLIDNEVNEDNKRN
jgi:hypothetical protein